MARVLVSTMGAFQAYYMAAAMERLGVLERVYTSNVRLVTGVPARRVRNYFPIKAAEYLAARFLNRDISLPAARLYDSIVAMSLPRLRPETGTVFHGWAMCSESSLITAKRRGMIAVLDRACPHVSFQRELLTDEARRQGLPPPEAGFLCEPRMLREYESADMIAVPSRYSYRSFLEHGVPQEKLRLVPLGVNRVDPNRRSRGGDSIFRVLFVGGNPLRKGLYYLLKAWAGLRLRDSELWIRGTVPASYMPAIAKDPSIQVISKLSKGGLSQLYRDASVFCLPSVDDGFGMAALEAMAFGLPVIVTNNVGASDVIRDGQDGFVIPTGNVESLMEKLAFFHDRAHAVESMGCAAFERAGEFSWDRYARAMLEAYEGRDGFSASLEQEIGNGLCPSPQERSA